MSNIIKYEIFFNFNGEIIKLPVNPEIIRVKKEGDNKAYQILKLGEINVLGDMKLSQIDFEVLLPGRIYPFVLTKENFKGPDFYLKKFDKHMKSKAPVRLVITGEPMAINQLVSIESMEYEKRAGEEEDVYMKLELKEYRDYGLKTFTVVGNNKGRIDQVYLQNVNRPKV